MAKISPKKLREFADKKRRQEHEVSNNVKTNVLAVVLMALSVISVLGFLGNAGILGRGINGTFGLLFGWGKWVFPLILLTGGIILIFRRKLKLFVLRLVGLGVVFVSLTGLIHIFNKPENMLAVAREGKGGGILGFGVDFILIKISGVTASWVILAALFSSGMIAAFNFAPASVFEKLHRLFKKDEEAEFVGDEAETPAETLPEKVEPEAPVDEVLAASNIKKVEFVDGPNKWSAEAANHGARNGKDIFSRDMEGKAGRRKKTLWQLPSLDLLEQSTGIAKTGDVEGDKMIIQKTLKHFGIEVEPAEVEVGPTVTRYSFRPAVGVKLSKITALNSNIAMALAARSVRIEAPIPGRSSVGIEVPNRTPAQVRLRSVLEDEKFIERQSNLTVALGQDVGGKCVFSDLAKMPHLLIAGSTGTGKSVCINSILISLLYQNTPDDLNIILVDPKRVELSLYGGIPHLRGDVIVDGNKAIRVLRWAVEQMEDRFKLLQDTSSRDIDSYNEKAKKGVRSKRANPETGEIISEEIEKLPYIVIVIDELADLMAAHGREIEGAVVRIAQMARAVGIHLIVSTQRPEVKIITGLIKANITNRIALQVATQIDSRTILDMAGAEKLLGNGDMLFLEATTSKPKRIQGVLVSESEVKRVVKFLRKNGEEVKKINEKKEGGSDFEKDLGAEAGDEFKLKERPLEEDEPLYEEAKRIVIEAGKASSSLLMVRLRIGYAKSARLIMMLEENGVIGPGDHAKPREILVGSSGEPDKDFGGGEYKS